MTGSSLHSHASVPVDDSAEMHNPASRGWSAYLSDIGENHLLFSCAHACLRCVEISDAMLLLSVRLFVWLQTLAGCLWPSGCGISRNTSKNTTTISSRYAAGKYVHFVMIKSKVDDGRICVLLCLPQCFVDNFLNEPVALGVVCMYDCMFL